MIGQTWNSEIREFRDEKTRRTIKQLTSTGNNVHLYFTENSFDRQKNEIIFRSDRASGADKAPHEDPLYNLFHMDLNTGQIVQSGIPRHPIAIPPGAGMAVVSSMPRIMEGKSTFTLSRRDGKPVLVKSLPASKKR